MLATYRYTAVPLVSFLLPALMLSAVQPKAYAKQVSSMPPGAFLRTPTADMNALNRELRTDKLVVSRYSRLMRLTPEMVRATFAQLHLTHMQKDMILEVHYVHAKETIGAKVRRLRKGTAVFAMSDGTPVLAQVCGNPLRSIRKNPTEVLGAAKFAQMGEMAETPDFNPEEPLNTPEHTAAYTSTLLDEAPTDEVRPESRDTLAVDEMPANATDVGEVIPSQTLGHAQNSLGNWVNGILPALIVIEGLGNSNAGTHFPPGSPPVRTHPRPVPTKPNRLPPLTPEPNSTLFALALATAMLATAGLRRRKAR